MTNNEIMDELEHETEAAYRSYRELKASHNALRKQLDDCIAERVALAKKIDDMLGELNLQARWTREAQAERDALKANNERLRVWALKAYTVVEFCVGEGFVLDPPHYDADDLLVEGSPLLGVEDSADARAALERRP